MSISECHSVLAISIRHHHNAVVDLVLVLICRTRRQPHCTFLQSVEMS